MIQRCNLVLFRRFRSSNAARRIPPVLNKPYGSEKNSKSGQPTPEKSRNQNRRDWSRIRDEAKIRHHTRNTSLMKEWEDSSRDVEPFMSQKDLQKAVEQSLSNANITRCSINLPIAIGDIVSLNEDSSILYLVVLIPLKLGCNHYTFINYLGEIQFGSKERVCLRFPRILPTHLANHLQNLVMKEPPYKIFAPVGIPDPDFTRRSKTETESLTQLEKEETVIEKDIQVLGHFDMEDFAIASATSQLLTDSDVVTYLVPSNARKIYSKPLLSLSLETMKLIPALSNKLEHLHLVLQLGPNGEPIKAPFSISIFELLGYLDQMENVDYTKKKYFLETLQMERKKIQQSRPFSRLGRHLESSNDVDQISVTTILSLMSILRQQSTYWIFNSRPGYLPNQITVIPLNLIESRKNAIQYISEKALQKKFANYIVSMVANPDSSTKTPNGFEEVVQLLKDYVAGNISNDARDETRIISFLRFVEQTAKEQDVNVFTDSPPPAFSYSKQRCFEILQVLQNLTNRSFKCWENPIKWSYQLDLPQASDTDPSRFTQSTLGQKYYELMESSLIDLDFKKDISSVQSEISLEGGFNNEMSFKDDFYSKDPFQSIRKDFSKVPIYCIDSASAHEIDDGISIQSVEDLELGPSYLISVHIANPSSYIKPFSDLSSIAFQKGTTTYLPEGPSMLLPSIISKQAGLGEPKSTRTFTVQYKLSQHLINEYIKLKRNDSSFYSSDILQKIKKCMEKSSDVLLGTACLFPQGYTYSKVNEILDDPNLRNQHLTNNLKSSTHRDLFLLDDISTIMKDLRIFNGNALSFDSESSPTVQVKENEGNGEIKFVENPKLYSLPIDGPQKTKLWITIQPNVSQNWKSKSQKLVSEMMISGNSAASHFATKNKIPIIYRLQSMEMHSDVEKQMKDVVKHAHLKEEQIGVEDFYNMITFLSPANFLAFHGSHQSLGVDQYATVTSPLRRYADIINHWMFEDYLAKKGESLVVDYRINPSALVNIAMHLQSREIINKQAQNFSNRYWTGVFIKQYLGLLLKKKIEAIQFRVLVKSKPNLDLVKVQLLDFPALKAEWKLKVDEESPRVGSVVTRHFDVVKLDYIEDELVLQSGN